MSTILKFMTSSSFSHSKFLGNLCVTMDRRSSSVKLKGNVTRKMSSTASAKSPSSSSNNGGSNMVSVDFEVFGKVQGVFFRKYTRQKGASLGLRGWCENTPRGTVVGQVEGPKEKVAEMKHWLKHEGSPKSRISQCVFQNEQSIPKYTFADFTVRR